EGMFTPRGSVHGFSNPHDRPARALIILTPDIGAQYFRDIAEAAGAPGGPNPARMAEIMTRYGLVLAKPPAGGVRGRGAGSAGCASARPARARALRRVSAEL